MRSDAGQLHNRSTPQRIFDILEVNQPCRMTIDQLAVEYEERYGEQPRLGTIRRAAHRLINAGYATSEIELYDDYDLPQKVGAVHGVRTPLGYRTHRRMLLGVA